mmetsp:Transcript_11666/g.34396  ORF Transcript_11666/g.34396 Transcript_11666/m.34396 type:complete len:250 (+) Transcript_11666:265-1014(+)
MAVNVAAASCAGAPSAWRSLEARRTRSWRDPVSGADTAAPGLRSRSSAAETSPAVALSAAAAAGPSKPIAASDASPGSGDGAGGSGTDGAGAVSTSMAEAGGVSSSIAAGTDGAGADTAGAQGLHTPKRRRSAAAALATRCSAASTAGGGGGGATGASGNIETAFATKAADARSPPCRAPLPASEASSRATVSFVEASAKVRCRPAALRVRARCSARTSAYKAKKTALCGPTTLWQSSCNNVFINASRS